MSQTISVINKSGMCYFLHTSNYGECAGMCTCSHMHQMENTGVYIKIGEKFLVELEVFGIFKSKD